MMVGWREVAAIALAIAIVSTWAGRRYGRKDHQGGT